MFEGVKLVLNGVEVPGLSWRDVDLIPPHPPGTKHTAVIRLVVDRHRYEYPGGQPEPTMILDAHSPKKQT